VDQLGGVGVELGGAAVGLHVDHPGWAKLRILSISAGENLIACGPEISRIGESSHWLGVGADVDHLPVERGARTACRRTGKVAAPSGVGPEASTAACSYDRVPARERNRSVYAVLTSAPWPPFQEAVGGCDLTSVVASAVPVVLAKNLNRTRGHALDAVQAVAVGGDAVMALSPFSNHSSLTAALANGSRRPCR